MCFGEYKTFKASFGNTDPHFSPFCRPKNEKMTDSKNKMCWLIAKAAVERQLTT